MSPRGHFVLLVALGACAARPTLPVCRLEPARAAAITAALAGLGPGARAAIWCAAPGATPDYALAADQPMPAASAIKTALLVELFAKFSPSLDQPFPGATALIDDARHPAVAHFNAQERATARKALGNATVRALGAAMITGKGVDNTTYNLAANLVIAHFGGPRAVTERLHARDASWRGLQLRRYMLADRSHGDNEATAQSLAAVFAMLLQERVPGVDARAIAAARATLAQPTAGDGSTRFFKDGALDSEPVTRVRSGCRTGPHGAVVWVVMLAQAGVGREQAKVSGERLAAAARQIEDLLLGDR